MRIVFKGGVWKNSEDEVLKAAISESSAAATRGSLAQRAQSLSQAQHSAPLDATV